MKVKNKIIKQWSADYKIEKNKIKKGGKKCREKGTRVRTFFIKIRRLIKSEKIKANKKCHALNGNNKNSIRILQWNKASSKYIKRVFVIKEMK